VQPSQTDRLLWMELFSKGGIDERTLNKKASGTKWPDPDGSGLWPKGFAPGPRAREWWPARI